MPMKSAENTIELSIGSSFEFIELVSSVTNTILNISGFDEDMSQWIELSVRESVINAIKHGNKEDPGKQVEVKFKIGDDALTILVIDQGNGFNPTHIPDPLDPSNLLNPNGRGIFYMRTFMDEVEYTNGDQGGTIVRMTKFRQQKS